MTATRSKLPGKNAVGTCHSLIKSECCAANRQTIEKSRLCFRKIWYKETIYLSEKQRSGCGCYDVL